jgi:hypothetical protein
MHEAALRYHQFFPNTTEQLVRENAYPTGSHAVSSEEWR